MNKITLAITTYNRYEMLLESFASVIDDKRIEEIIICDDGSDEVIHKSVVRALDFASVNIRYLRHVENVGMQINKMKAVAAATTRNVILFDSDNILKSDYLDALVPALELLDRNENVIFCPSFARPGFDYRKFSGKLITANNVKSVAEDSMGNCLLNTCNYVVNRDLYLKTFKQNDEVRAADTIYFNYLHLKSGGCFYVVEGMEYFHRQHEGSGFLKDLNYNMVQAEKTRQLIKQL